MFRTPLAWPLFISGWRTEATLLGDPDPRGSIPFGIANFKMIPISLVPLGSEIVRIDQPFATR
ncbi:hypothetical protein [Streptomyces sioyaensis]|uniref:hypothetical protein n=1 Tax=Streptomyces sioyaensis TaxID=67364 RepID=UPI00371A17FD